VTGPSRLVARLLPLPLRWRVAVAFAVASVLITGLLALVTWSMASDYMTDQRQQSAQRQFAANSRLVTSALRRHPGLDPHEALLQLEYDQDDTVALQAGGRWAVDGPLTDLPTLGAVAARRVADPADSTVPEVVGGQRVLVTALQVAPDARYLELAGLTDLGHTLAFLRTVLAGGVAAGVVVGLVLGRWAAGQALRPLTELNRAAERVAAGDLRARLSDQGDADLTALAHTFNRTTAALEQRVARDTRFAADVSHELRSPLTTMVNALAVLNRRTRELSPTGKHALRLLTDDMARFQQMVVDLLEISRNHAVDELELEPCDLAELVRHTVTARHEHAPLRVAQPPPTVLADRRRLDRVVANLLDNAERHAGGVVLVAVSRRDGRARLEVDDAGPGVPPELRGQIFERFTRAGLGGSRDRDTGSGLGLALVAQHIHGHDGTVWVEDRPGGGSRFVVELPLAPRPRP
jgi:two-component system, OmpR family, sensor histidine kinase MtrB